MDDSKPPRRKTITAAVAIFAITVLLRVPSCYESFWVDELHSAWTIWEGLAEVPPRARVGHQMPVYFAGLWVWKQAVGGSEVALRLSSVLAVGTSCIVLTMGVAKWTRSVVAGAAAGMVLAVETNSLFFGTELRPYAFVILMSSIALVFFLRLATLDQRQQDSRAWSGLIGSILLAVLCQPTAVGILAWLPIALSVIWLARSRRQFLRFSLSDGLLALAAVAVGFAVWEMTLSETWDQRARWASFATATRAAQIWEVWDWTELLVLPLVLMWVAAAAAKLRKQHAVPVDRLVFPTVVLAAIAAMGTCLYWAISRADWVPVWHRRYFISVLPMFACIVGGSVGVAIGAIRPPRSAGVVAISSLAFVLLVNLTYQQGTLVRLRTYPVALVTRGEDWRSAVRWVQTRAEKNDEIQLHSGLIEVRNTLKLIDAGVPNAKVLQHLNYLAYPVRGPYRLEHSISSIYRLPSADWTPASALTTGRIFIITRISGSRLSNSPMPLGSRVIGFGNVSVIVLPSQLDQNFGANR